MEKTANSSELDWLQRLRVEENDLATRTAALSRFIVSNSYYALPDIDRLDLAAQLRIMRDLLTVLRRRLDRVDHVG